MNRKLFFLTIFLGAFCAPLVAAEPYAWYRADAGLQSSGGLVTSWEDAGKARPLTHIFGTPRVWKVRTPAGVTEVVRFDGNAAVWQPAQSWGRLEGARTVLVFARIPRGADGVLCDGSTRSGADAIRVQGDDRGWQVLRFERTNGSLGGFILGADVATKNGLKCDVAEVLVFASAISEAEFAAQSARLKQKWGEPVDLPDTEQAQPFTPFAGLTTKFLRKSGDDGVNTYRIPGLATSTNGTLLAVFDLRHNNGGDLPGKIDVGLTRSTDDGETWSATQQVLHFEGSGVGDPTILVDRETGRIFVAALWSKGNRAWNGSGPGMTPEETGQFVITRSDDDGVTWSPPVSITAQVKRPEWRLCFNGPGSGIQLRDGTLVLPAQFREAKGTPHSCFISSRDHGKSWQMSPLCVGPTSESQVAELSDGGVLITMRDESRSGQRLWAKFDGKNWSEPWRALPDPTCQASLLRHPNGTLLFSNPANAKARRTLTVRTSQDDGKSWSAGRVVDPRAAMYSCMTVMRDGRIAMLYEGTGGLILARFAVEGANLAALPEGRFETTGKFGWWPARHAAKLAETKAGGGDILFLGDSITQNWETAGKAVWEQHYAGRTAANYGFGGDSTQHVLWRLDHGEFDGLKPKVCVLHIGTNTARHGDFTPAQIAEGIRAVLDRLAVKCPQTQVLLLAIFPRDADATGEMRRKCEAVNALLPALADGKRVHFLNLNAAFLQPDGTLTRAIAPDLLHLSATGYERWATAMAPKLNELLGRK